MMGFREIRSSEKITDQVDERNQAYLKINPENKTTMNEVEAFWAEEFRKAGENHSEE